MTTSNLDAGVVFGGAARALNGRRFALAAAAGFAAVSLLAVYSLYAIHSELTAGALSRRTALASLAAATLAEKFDRAVDVGVALATRVRFRDLVAAGRWAEAASILREAPADIPYI